MTIAQNDMTDPAVRWDGPIVMVANPGSGRNSHDAEVIDKVQQALGADLRWVQPGSDIGDTALQASRDGAGLVLSCGGDGTAMAVASALLGSGTPVGILPFGTFNYFARGQGLSEDPVEAAQQIANGQVKEMPLAKVNDQVFLNNVSIGIYPTILREREDIYARWGRRRVLAYWSVIKTFLRFRKPLKVTIDHGTGPQVHRTALVFVGRSAYQFARFGLEGTEAIRDGGFAVLVIKAATRWELFKATARLTLRSTAMGKDYELITTDRLTISVDGGRRTLIAYDGEKRHDKGTLTIAMSDEKLHLVRPLDEAA